MSPAGSATPATVEVRSVPFGGGEPTANQLRVDEGIAEYLERQLGGRGPSAPR